MENKKIITRNEFELLLKDSARKMAMDSELISEAMRLKVKAGYDYYWVHQTKWLGEPILNLPQDMFAIQEIIYNTRPKYFIEVGTAWGGGLLFYSSLMEILGGEKVIGIDVFIPQDLKDRIGSHGRISDRIVWIEGSSIEENTISRVKEIVGESKEVMVLLDSHHTHEHVYKELSLYSGLIGKGYYLICGDTVLEHQPASDARPRPWGKGNNPQTALNQFMKENDRFVIDHEMSDKLLFTCNPGGYLRAVKD
jgi:cephalosporin hydroxylase